MATLAELWSLVSLLSQVREERKIWSLASMENVQSYVPGLLFSCGHMALACVQNQVRRLNDSESLLMIMLS